MIHGEGYKGEYNATNGTAGNSRNSLAIMGINEMLEQARTDERKAIAKVMRALETWGQLNIKDFPLVTAMINNLEQGKPIEPEK